MRFVLSRVRLVLRRLALLVTVTLNCLICFLYFALFALCVLKMYYSTPCPKRQVCANNPMRCSVIMRLVQIRLCVSLRY